MRPSFIRSLNQELFQKLFMKAFFDTTGFAPSSISLEYRTVLSKLKGIDLENIEINNEILYMTEGYNTKLPIFYLCINSKTVYEGWIEIYYNINDKGWDARFCNANQCEDLRKTHKALGFI